MEEHKPTRHNQHHKNNKFHTKKPSQEFWDEHRRTSAVTSQKRSGQVRSQTDGEHRRVWRCYRTSLQHQSPPPKPSDQAQSASATAETTNSLKVLHHRGWRNGICGSINWCPDPHQTHIKGPWKPSIGTTVRSHHKLLASDLTILLHDIKIVNHLTY